MAGKPEKGSKTRGGALRLLAWGEALVWIPPSLYLVPRLSPPLGLGLLLVATYFLLAFRPSGPKRISFWLLALALPPLLDSSRLWVLFIVALYALLGIGLNVVVGLAGLLDLGYVAFFAIGAYTYALLASPFFDQHWPFPVLLPLALALATLAGVLLGMPVLRMRGDYLAIVTLAFGEIIRLLLLNLTGLTGGPNGIIRIDRPAFLGMRLDELPEFYYLALAAAGLAGLVTERMRNSRLGRAWEALREDEDAARAQGIAHVPYKLLSFALGAALGGLGGVVFALSQGNIFPSSFTLDVSIRVLSIVIIGGMGSVSGAVLGSFLIAGLPEVMRDVALGPLRPADYRLILYGALLVAFMVWRPAGLVPSPRRLVEFQTGEGEAE